MELERKVPRDHCKQDQGSSGSEGWGRIQGSWRGRESSLEQVARGDSTAAAEIQQDRGSCGETMNLFG